MEELKSFEQIKTLDELTGALNSELNRAAISFVRIGFLLKTARDTDILKDSQYANMNEYAQDRFGLDKSQVSRFININDRFSIGGYSEHLKVEYEGYGQAKLALMLTLPDEINAELSPEYSKADIQAIKDEYDAEKEITPLEVMAEPKADQPETEGDEFVALVVKQINDEHPDPIYEFHFNSRALAENLGIPDALDKVETATADIKECYMPDEECAYNIRINGQGRFLITMRDKEITVTNMRSLEKSSLSWEEFAKAVLEDEAVREFKKPMDPQEQKAKREKVHQSEIQKKARKVQERYEKAKVEEKQPENDENGTKNDENGTKNDENAQNPTENVQKLTEEIEKVEGEVVDSEGQRIDNAPQNVPYPDGEEPEITHVSSEDPLPKENDEAAGDSSEISGSSIKTAGDSSEAASDKEDMLIQQLNDLLYGSSSIRARTASNEIKDLHHRGYREHLDAISGWIADVNNTTGRLYAILAGRGQ